MKDNLWFDSSLSLEEGKSLYRKLLKENHPDVGGSEEVCQAIIQSFERFCKIKMQFAFNDVGDEKTGDADVNHFANVLADIINFNCRIEIIGFWIYAFDSYEVKDLLKAKGFFWSMKHKAWIFNGEGKRKIRTNYNIDDNRRVHGYQVIREKAQQLAIA